MKDKKVLTLKDIQGVPSDIQKIDAPELLPVCLQADCTFEQFKKWLDRRNIPEQREGLKEMKDEFKTSWLENKNYASLTDQYWLRKRGESWKKINFFNNIYSKDIGDMAFVPWTVSKKKYDTFSPDLTTNGVLRKRWVQLSDRTSVLVKAASAATHQEPLSEVLVSLMAEELDIIPYVKYDLCVEGMIMCSKCNNFITEDTEFVPAYDIYFAEEKKEGEGVYDHILNMCEKFGIPDMEEFLKGVITIDNITGNEDRNLGNIGFIRDVNTMKFVGPAPLFDCGNAYWNTKNVCDTVKSKFFGDVENNIVSEMKKKYDLAKLKKMTGYKKLIQDYPCVSDTKKERLIEAIGKQNRRLEIEFER